jgi:phage tail-like protein
MGDPVTWFDEFLFRVEIDDVISSAFTTCSDLKKTTGKTSHRQGGVRIATKEPGLIDVPDITLTRGACSDHDLWTWMKQVYDAKTGKGSVPATCKKSFDIVQLNLAGEEVERWHVMGAFPVDFTAGKWDNNQDGTKRIESITLSVDDFDLVD